MNEPRKTRSRCRRTGAAWLASCLLALGVAWSALPAIAASSPSGVPKVYEDAVARFDKRDYKGANIQLKNVIAADPDFLPAHMLAGRVHLSLGNAIAAQQSFEEAIRLGVARSEVIPLLAQALLEQAKYKELLERIDVSGLTGRTRAETLVMRAYAELELGNDRLANTALEDAQRADARYAGVAVAFAHLSVRGKDFPAARRHAERAITLEPANARAWNVKATIVQAQGDAAAALAAYGKAVELDPSYDEPRLARAAMLIDLARDKEAAADIEKIRESVPDDPRANYLRAVLLGRSGDSKGVLTALTDVTRVTEILQPEVFIRKPQYLLIAGMAYHGLRNPEQAKANLGRFIALDPSHLGARRLLGSLLVAERDYSRAVPVLEPFAKARGVDAYALTLLASAYLGLNRRQSASDVLDRAVQPKELAPEVRASLGFTLLGAGRFDTALDYLRRAFKEDATNVEVANALVMLDVKRGQPKLAVQTAEGLAKRLATDPRSHNLLGVARAAASDFKGARGAYEQAIARSASFAPAHLNLAKLDVAERQYDQGRSRLNALLKRQPRNAEAAFELARLERVADRGSEAVRLLEKLLAEDGSNFRAGIELVEVYLSMNQPDKAMITARDLEIRAPDRLDVLDATCRSYLAAGRSSEARRVLELMTRLAGFDLEQQVRIARFQLAAGNPAGARYSLDKALSGTPEALPALVLLAEMELAQGNVASAEQTSKRIATRYPNEAVNQRLAGDVAMARGNTAGAIKYYQAAFDRNRETDTAMRLARALTSVGQSRRATEMLASAWAQGGSADAALGHALGEAYIDAGDFPAAQRVYESMLKAKTNDPVILNNLAEVLHRQKKPEALGYAERAYQAAPQAAVTNDTRGWILVERGDVENGLRYLREARLRDPRDRNIRYHLAFALAKAGRVAEARSELAYALEGKESFASAEAARKLLSQLAQR